MRLAILLIALTIALVAIPTAEADTKARWGCSASSPIDDQPGIVDTRVGARCTGEEIHAIVNVPTPIFCIGTSSYC